MNIIIKHLKELFEKKISSDFKEYIALNNKSSCYLLLSDYALYNSDKNNDVISYTLIPCEKHELKHIIDTIKEHAKKDIKKTRSVRHEFIEVLNRKSLFHINFLLGDRRVFKEKGRCPREKMLESIQFSINELSISSRSDEQEWVKLLEKYKSEVAKKSSNLKLMTDISIVSLLTAYIMFLLTKEGNIKEVGWMSDRDKITEAYDQIAFTLCQINYHAICVMNNIPTRNVEKMYYFPTEKGIFYPDLVRIPDYIVGTLADWDKSSPTVSKEKFVTVIREVISENKFCKIFSLSFTEMEMCCNEYMLTLK